MLPVIFVVAYIAMAWYDYMYNCDTIMYAGKSIGLNTLDSIFKPQRRKEKPDKNKKLMKNQEQEYLFRVYLFHVVAIAPILIYLGYYGAPSNPQMFPVLLWIGVVALLYHGFRLFFPRDTYASK